MLTSKKVPTLIYTRYLLSQYSGPFIDSWAAHLNMALVCTTYQCFQCFEPNISNDQAAIFVLNGDLRLLDYVQLSWLEHVKYACRLCVDLSQLRRLSAALRELFGRRGVRILHDGSPPHQTNILPGVSLGTVTRNSDFDRLEIELGIEIMRTLEYRENFKQKASLLGACDGMQSLFEVASR